MTAPKIGSGLFTGATNATQGSIHQHLVQASHGFSGELAELWRSLVALFNPAAAIAVEEFTAPPTASTTAVMPAQATVSGPQTFTGSPIVNTAFATAPRNLTVTGGGTTAQCPASVLITGKDSAGKAQTETIALTAGSGTGVKAWSSVTSAAFTGGTGTAGTEALGTGIALGLSVVPKARGGATTSQPPISEAVDHATPTAGVIDPTNHTYTPNAAPNAAHIYVVFYEYDPTLITVPGEI